LIRTKVSKEVLALLYVSGQDTPYGEMKFHEDLIPYNNKIVECSYDFEVMTWVFIRVREDKGWPNYLTIADAICNTIEFPVTETNLLQALVIFEINILQISNIFIIFTFYRLLIE